MSPTDIFQFFLIVVIVYVALPVFCTIVTLVIWDALMRALRWASNAIDARKRHKTR